MLSVVSGRSTLTATMLPLRVEGEVNHPHAAFPEAVLKAIRARVPGSRSVAGIANPEYETHATLGRALKGALDNVPSSPATGPPRNRVSRPTIRSLSGAIGPGSLTLSND